MGPAGCKTHIALVARATILDRKAKAAMAGMLLVIAAIIAVTIKSSIMSMTPDAAVAAQTPEGADELMQIAGHTLLLKHGSAGNRITHWLHARSNDSEAFELGDQSFAAGSEALSAEGERRAG